MAESDDLGEAPQPASLEPSITNLLEEPRMLLPGTQTLFGCQLIVVVNSTLYSAGPLPFATGLADEPRPVMPAAPATTERTSQVPLE